MFGWFGRLVDHKDASVDSLVVFGVLGVLALTGLSAYSLIALGQSFSPISFGSAFATIIGASGAAVGMREKMDPNQGNPPPCSGSPPQS